MFEGGPLKNQKLLLQNCIFQYEDLTKLTVAQIYNTINFFRKFVNLLRLEGKAHQFLPEGIHKKYVIIKFSYSGHLRSLF